MGVFDTLTQPPVEAFKPDKKQSGVDIDTIYGEEPPPPSMKGCEVDVFRKMDVGPLNYEDRAHLKHIVMKHVDAFAQTPDDIGSFTGFTYPLKYKPDANLRLAYTKPYPSSIDSQPAINEWIKRMYKAGVIERAPPDT